MTAGGRQPSGSRDMGRQHHGGAIRDTMANGLKPEPTLLGL